MDTNNQVLTDEEKKKIYDDLADAVMNALESGQILDDEGRKSSDFILQNLDTITTKESLSSFLQTLVNKWPIYKDIQVKFLDQQAQLEVKKKIDELNNNVSAVNNQ